MKKRNKFKLTRTICDFLVLMAPVMVATPFSFFFWGEVPVPDMLKNDVSRGE